MSAFDRLSAALQYQIVNTLGFQGLRPVQELAAAEILEGRNCVVLAPTAGGKTEAAFFPLLSRMDTESWEPVSVIYVAPIRALLNNLEARIEKYTGLIGRRAFKWHGDIAPSKKKAFIADPADILLTTPESLEVMLMSAKVPAGRLFRALQAVVIDEIHAFVGDDRGGHLSAVLERLSRYCGRDVQRIGLSATVGNPPDILTWSAGSSKREGRVVDPGGQKAKPELRLDFVGNDANAAKVIAALHPGEKRLVFVDSRRRVEAIGKLLREHEVDVYVTHSSLSVGERQMAEAFERGSNCVIVATSALELGIDIGDLDRVIQIDAPSTVAAFLQRMGRTGRRTGTTPNCLFLATSDDTLVQAAAILRLHGRGFVEPVPLQRRSAHLLAHQLMALSIQTGGVPRSDWWSWVSAATPFTGLTEADRAELLDHMLAEDILAEVGGQLVLGDAGEKRYGRRNFGELYAVFQAPRSLRVLWGGQEIGTIDAFFAESEEVGNLSFVLGARSWRAVEIRWNDGFVIVEPIDRSQLPRWQGSTRLLGRELCQTMREILVADDYPDTWSARARDKIDAIRAEFGFLDREPGLDLASDDRGYRLWTFAGGRANNLIGKVLESELGEKVTLDNRYIGFRDEAARSAAAIADAVAKLKEAGRPGDEDALRFASLTAHRRLSKFQPCLTDRLEAIFLADELTDPEVSRRTLELPIRISG